MQSKLDIETQRFYKNKSHLEFNHTDFMAEMVTFSGNESSPPTRILIFIPWDPFPPGNTPPVKVVVVAEWVAHPGSEKYGTSLNIS